MKPIVSFDVDMTLLDHKDWTIPASAMETLEKLKDKYTIVLATGRDMDSSFSMAIKEMINPDAIIHLNGTKITVGSELIYEHLFDKGLIERILSFAEEKHYSVGASIEENDFYTCPDVVTRHDMELWGECGRRFGDPWKLKDLDVRTMAYIGNETGAKDLEKCFPEINVHMFAEKQGADLVEKVTSKAMGLKRLCAYYGVPVSDTFAFGDSMNDYDIIKAAGVGIAMGNAIPKLKSVASEITDSVDNDGIAQSFKKHFNI